MLLPGPLETRGPSPAHQIDVWEGHFISGGVLGVRGDIEKTPIELLLHHSSD